MTSTCDEILEAIFLGRTLQGTEAAHVKTCGRCQREERIIRALSQVLAEDTVPEPAPALTQRVLAAAAPVLAGYDVPRIKAYRWRLARALSAALLPLPAILVVDTYVIRGLHAALSMLLPAFLTTYVVFHLAALMLLAVTLTYGAVPLLADRQIRLAWSKQPA